MSNLDKLIEAVDAGTAGWYDLPRLCEAAFGDGWNYADAARSAYNGSLDAAKRLHETLLPGWEWHLGPSNAKIYPFNGSPLKSWAGSADTAARAWLLAILRAMRAKEAGG